MNPAKMSFLLGLLVASPLLAHGPQMQITNDNNKVTTRQIYADAPYNVYPQAPSAVTSVYVMPLAAINSFGGTSYWAQPNESFPVSSPGIGWTYGWTYDTAAHTTFPIGSNFVEKLVGGLQQYNGSAFVPAVHSAQVQIFKSAANSGVSGTSPAQVTLKTLAAPTSPSDTLLDDHTTVNFQLLGDGIVPRASHVPGAVDDGIYMAQLLLSLANQPATSDPRTVNYDPAHPVQDSDPFYFVFYKGTSSASALTAAQSAFPTASIQVVPEPTTMMLGVVVMLTMQRRRARSFSLTH